ncbi:MAG TPA: trypsin-like peptidase domain-containing protein [Bacteroidales bacterium]|nr:trypsin-like peptidase domain-containing protein [Bacteroidales bacterium]HPR58441.1 trypsin-like peptidase domain-containing protein [Bacteroidales bacterium]HRW97281.1 trypsin-like peptidase domain-containing protein [Bacteroidales bacterium]
MKKFGSFLLVALLGGLFALGAYQLFENRNNEEVTYPATSGSYTAAQSPSQTYLTSYAVPENVPDFIAAADMTVHAVVHIKTEVSMRNSIYDDFFFEFFGIPPQPSQPLVATGSGVIITSDGYIVTNNHVVQNAIRLEVTLNDKRSFEAEIVGTDPSTDLALIKIDASGLPFLSYGDSDQIQVGEWVLAVGNPFNLTSTVTAGIVSAKARNINILGTAGAIESFIQTDAPVNRGNSGGALVNTKGELVGINAAIASNTGSYAGYSFAIPVNIVKKVVTDFITFGELQRAYIGVTIRDIDSEFAKEIGLDSPQGVYVVSVVENSSADDADIRAKDIIIEIEGKPINSVSHLLETIGQRNPGDRVSVKINRENKIIEKSLLLKNRENSTEIIVSKDKVDNELLGAVFEEVPVAELDRLGIKNGVQVKTLRHGELLNKGVREGFIITHIDKSPVKNADDIEKLLEGKRGGVLLEGVYPSGKRSYYALGL